MPVASAGGVHTGIVGMACIACCFLRHRTNAASAPKATITAEPCNHLSKSQGSGIMSEPCHQNSIPHPMLNQMLARMKLPLKRWPIALNHATALMLKREPIEPHHEHEYYRNGPHFPYQFSVFVISTAACAARSAACTVPADSSNTAIPARRFALIDMLCCTNEVRQTRRSMFGKNRPRLLPPVASTAQRPR